MLFRASARVFGTVSDPGFHRYNVFENTNSVFDTGFGISVTIYLEKPFSYVSLLLFSAKTNFQLRKLQKGEIRREKQLGGGARPRATFQHV